jgi:drug/metabolite transporter (DMT)-like permease
MRPILFLCLVQIPVVASSTNWRSTLSHPPAASKLHPLLGCPLRLRGGLSGAPPPPPPTALRAAGDDATTVSATTARLLLLLGSAIYGTYPVILRGLKAVGGEPLPAVFVAFVRYQFLILFAGLLRVIRSLQARTAVHAGAVPAMTPSPKAFSGQPSSPPRHLWLAASELALYTLISSVLSIFAVSRLPAVMSEIIASMTHIFVPFQTLVLLKRTGFGIRTWAGCGLAFGAVVLAGLTDMGGDAGVGMAQDRANALIGQGAMVASAFAFGLSRVRAQVHLQKYPAEQLNTARFVCMGSLSAVPLLIDLVLGGESRVTLTRLHKVLPAQWLLMGLSVFLSAFVGSQLNYVALKVVPAANAQPFSALQPLFAAAWSMLLLSEPISAGSLAGGAVMITATLLACTDKILSP